MRLGPRRALQQARDSVVRGLFERHEKGQHRARRDIDHQGERRAAERRAMLGAHHQHGVDHCVIDDGCRSERSR